MPHPVWIQAASILVCTALLAAAIYFLSRYRSLYRGVSNVWLRRNLSVLSVAALFMSALLVFSVPELFAEKKSVIAAVSKQLMQFLVIVLFVFNTVWVVSRIPAVKRMSFVAHHVVIVVTMVISAVAMYIGINLIDYGPRISRVKLHQVMVFAYLNSVVAGLIYTAVNYVEQERKRKLNEKELEVTRLMALKTKAELDALHSKVNPHFLYNALNSIADLSITDGRKARRMTIALADLFRYSINYSQNNYSTVRDEVNMTEVYLQIEKIRFEDQLAYTVNVEEATEHYLVPRFLLQPLVENAVKHGLKATGKMTEIRLSVTIQEGTLFIIIADNGPAFPDEFNPGYGVKSVYDKLDLLFPGEYEIHFSNEPVKQVSVRITKLMKNEPAL